MSRLLLRRREVRAAAVVLVAAAVVLGLRAGADPAPAPPRVGPAAVLPTPPFDRLPGRTAIPAPTRSGSRLVGALPAVGGPGEAAALRAAGLVLGRYCREPGRYTLDVAPRDGFDAVTVLVFALDRSGEGPAVTVDLRWTGRTYRWESAPDLDRGC